MPTSIRQCFLLELNVKHFNALFQSRQEVPDWLAEYATSGGGGDAGGFSGRFASKDIRRKGKVCGNSSDDAAAPSPFMLVYTVAPSQSAVQLTSCTSSLRVVIAIYENDRPHQVFTCIIFPSRWPACHLPARQTYPGLRWGFDLLV